MYKANTATPYSPRGMEMPRLRHFLGRETWKAENKTSLIAKQYSMLYLPETCEHASDQWGFPEGTRMHGSWGPAGPTAGPKQLEDTTVRLCCEGSSRRNPASAREKPSHLTSNDGSNCSFRRTDWHQISGLKDRAEMGCSFCREI